MGNVRNKLWRIFYAKEQNTETVFNEGGSRSGKTYDTFLFLLDLVSMFPDAGLKIDVYRDTLTRCRKMALADFKGCLKIHRIPTKTILSENNSPRFIYGRNVINFEGLDKMGEVEAGASDIVFINELLSGVTELQFTNVTKRCTKMVVADWNPKYTKHWAYAYEGRPNVTFTHTTFLDNVHCPQEVKNKLLSYEPTPENIANGTADDYNWDVYGLGKRCSREGLVFTRYTRIKELPEVKERFLVADYGFENDPTAVLEMRVSGDSIYIDELCYNTQMLLGDIVQVYKTRPKYEVVSESANPMLVADIKRAGINILPVSKPADGIEVGIARMKELNIHITERSTNVINEFDNYSYKQDKDGNWQSKPIDKYNHAIDAIRYGVLYKIMGIRSKKIRSNIAVVRPTSMADS